MIKLFKNTRGSFAIPSALALPAIIGAGGIALEVNRVHDAKTQLQRATDMVALGTAAAFKAIGPTPDHAYVIEPTAKDIAVANGIPANMITVTYDPNYNGVTGQHAITVRVKKPVPINLGRVVTNLTNFDVASVSVAALAMPKSPACIIALGTGTGVSASGGARLTASGCAINTNGNALVSGSAQITAASMDLGGIKQVTEAGQIASTPNPNRVYQDVLNAARNPLEGDTRIAAALAQLGQFTGPLVPTDPVTPTGTNFNFDPWVNNGDPRGWPFNQGDPSTQAWRIGSTGSYVVPPGNYTIRQLRTVGGVSVTFQAPSTITISQGIDHAGSNLVFAPGSTFRINGGIDTHGYAPVSFGDGDYQIGNGPIVLASSGTINFGNGRFIFNNTVNIGAGTHLTIGNGEHVIRAIRVGDGGSLRIGTGNLNVTNGIEVLNGSQMMTDAGYYAIGPNPSTGDAIRLNGSSMLFMVDGPFSANGNVNELDGGSRLVIGKTENHFINGNLWMRGAVLFGDGRYVINGEFINGTGGTRWPVTSRWGITYGSNAPYNGYDMAGQNVTFVTTGRIRLDGGAKMNMLAATTNSVPGAIQDILFVTNTTEQTRFGQGSGTIVNGTILAPNSDMVIADGATFGSGSGCLMLIVKTVAATGGAVGGTTCPSILPLLNAFDVALVR